MKPIHQIDRKSPMPVYQQIAADISARICQGEWPVGAKIASENELTQEYAVSRVTVHQALAKLQLDGLIDKQRGRGTFVKQVPGITVQDLYLPKTGRHPASDVKSRDIRLYVVHNAPERICSQLEVPTDTPLVCLERIFVRASQVLAINQAWFPAHMVPEMSTLPLINNSITDTLQERYHVRFTSVDNYIESIAMDTGVAQILKASPQTPALKISSVYRVVGGQPIEYATTIWNGRDTQFHVVLSSEG